MLHSMELPLLLKRTIFGFYPFSMPINRIWRHFYQCFPEPLRTSSCVLQSQLQPFSKPYIYRHGPMK